MKKFVDETFVPDIYRKEGDDSLFFCLPGSPWIDVMNRFTGLKKLLLNLSAVLIFFAGVASESYADKGRVVSVDVSMLLEPDGTAQDVDAILEGAFDIFMNQICLKE